MIVDLQLVFAAALLAAYTATPAACRAFQFLSLLGRRIESMSISSGGGVYMIHRFETSDLCKYFGRPAHIWWSSAYIFTFTIANKVSRFQGSARRI
jgi:hypothetical protein